MRRHWGSLVISGLAAGLSLLAAPAVRATVPALQVAPLQYESELKAGRISSGVIDVANPSDAATTIRSSVQGFRQIGSNGDLEFFDDPELTAAIKPGLDEFILGPREAVRVVFSIDASKLPQGGTYAAIFFQTSAPDQASRQSFITESAKVGTLLILTNGSGAAHHGRVTGLRLPLWQLGDGLSGRFAFENTDTSIRPVGFKPQLVARVTPWGRSQAIATGLVLPGTTRQFKVNQRGAYFGFLPITVTDADTETHDTVWVLACTGWWRWVVLLVALSVGWYMVRSRRQHNVPISNDEVAEK